MTYNYSLHKGNDMETEQRTLALNYIRLVFVTLFWAGAFIAGRYTVGEVPPFTVAFFRFVAASLVLMPLVWLVEGSRTRITRQDLPRLLLLGLTGIFIYNSLFFTGLKHTTAANAAIIVAINPVVTAIISALFLKEVITRRQLAGILLSFTGVAVVVTRGSWAVVQGLEFNFGDMVLVGAPVAWALYSVLGKGAMKKFSPLAATAYACLFGTLMLLPLALWEGHPWPQISLPAWGAFAYMGVFTTSIAFIWWYRGIAMIGASRSAIFINLVPLWTMLLAFLILGEQVTSLQLLGAALIISGVYLSTYGTAGARARQAASHT